MINIRYTFGADYDPNSSSPIRFLEYNGNTYSKTEYLYIQYNGSDYFVGQANTGYLITAQDGQRLTPHNAGFFVDFSEQTGPTKIPVGDYGDVVRSGSGNDELDGGGGNDVLEGGGGRDSVKGGAGSDTASYAHSSTGVTVDLGLAAPTAQVSAGDADGDLLDSIENLTGSAFADELAGDGVDNTLDGGAGNDVLEGRGGADTFRGGDGIDTVSYEHSADTVVLYLGSGGIGGEADGDSYTDIENIRGSDVVGPDAYNDFLYGNGSRNVIEGGRGADYIDGQGGGDVASYAHSSAGVNVTVNRAFGNTGGDAEGDRLENVRDLLGSAYADTLTGDGQNNILDGGGDADTLTGGAGNDTYYVDNTSDSVVEIDGTVNGTDTVYASVAYTLADGQAVETLRGYGSAGLALTGNGSDNTVIGQAGNDTLGGGGGNDILIGGGGTDRLVGGLGNDTYIVDGGYNVIETSAAGGGLDTVKSSASITLNANIENLVLTGTDNIYGAGNAANNAIIGNGGKNVLTGYAGADQFSGGLGADTFMFRTLGDSTVATTGRDLIRDFSHAQGDRINLSLIDANTTTAATNDAFTFIGASAFSGSAGQLRAVDSGSAYTLVSGDVNGDAVADFSILVNKTAFVTSDFVL